MTNDDIMARLCKKIALKASQEAWVNNMTQEEYADELINILIDRAARGVPPLKRPSSAQGE